MQSAARTFRIGGRVFGTTLTVLALVMLGVTALMIYIRVRHPNAISLWMPCECLFLSLALLALVWHQTWPNKIPRWLRVPVLSANTFRIGLIGYLLIAFAIVLRLAAKYQTGPDAWIFKIAPWLFAFPLPLLVWFTVRTWSTSSGQRHSIWNVVFLCAALAGMLSSVFAT